MGLYLCVFSGDDVDEEIIGCEVGSYADFERFRTTVCDRLENGSRGSVFPVLMTHHDSDGVWSRSQLPSLRSELETIHAELAAMEPQQGVTSELADAPCLDACFVDVNRQPLTTALLDVVEVAMCHQQPIWFQ